MTNNNVKVSLKERLRLRFNNFKEDWNNPTKKRIRNKRTAEIGGGAIRTFVLIGLCFIILLPIFQKISMALRYPTDISDPQVIWIPGTFSFENIRIAYHYLSYKITFVNSLILSFFSMCIQVIATATAGYAFARLRFPGSKILFYVVLFTLIVPNETLDLARFLYFQNTNFFGIDLIFNIS